MTSVAPHLRLGCELPVCAAAHRTISRATVTNTCQPQHRTTVNARVCVKVDTSITHTALVFASEATSTSQQNCRVRILTAGVKLSGDDLNASFTVSSRECADTTPHMTTQWSNADGRSCNRPSACCSTITDAAATFVFNWSSSK